MPKAQHAALKRKGLSDESAYKIMNAQKTAKKAKKKSTARKKKRKARRSNY